MSVAAFVLGVVGLVIGTFSLGWQLASFHLSGGRVKAELRRGFIGLGGAALGSPELSADEAARLRSQGFQEEVVAIVVRNRGRLPAMVDSVYASYENGFVYEHIEDGRSPVLPLRLEPDGKATFYIPMRDLENVVRACLAAGVISVPRLSVRGAMTTGGGRSTRTKASVTIAAG